MSYTEELAWASGFFEAEGSIVEQIPGSKRIRLSCCSVDKDIIEKFHRIVGVGYITTVEPRGISKKLQYIWICNTQEDVHFTLDDMWPGLMSRRRNKAIELGYVPHGA